MSAPGRLIPVIHPDDKPSAYMCFAALDHLQEFVCDIRPRSIFVIATSQSQRAMIQAERFGRFFSLVQKSNCAPNRS
jgi:hypothetical protein